MAAAVAITSTSFSTTAGAAPGDYSYAHAQFLQGDLLFGQLQIGDIADLVGEQAESTGTATDGPYQGNLDLTVLGVIPLQLPGGLQLPLEQTEIGVVGQYARASANGASLAATGAITSDGMIGTGLEFDEPGALTLGLDGLLTSLGVPQGVLDDVAVLDLRIDGVSARAEQVAPNAPVGTYSIDDVELVLQSDTLGNLVSLLETTVMTQVAALVTTLQAQALGLVNGALAQLPDEVLSVSVNITGTDSVANVISNLTTLDAPGIRIDLLAGTITLDIDELVQLNGRAPNTSVLTPEVLGGVLANALTLLGSVTDNVAAALGGIGVDVDIQIAGQALIDLSTTIGALLGGGLGQLLAPLIPADLQGLIDQVVGELAAPLALILNTGLTDLVSLLPALVSPLLAQLTPVFDAVAQVVRLTVNVQEPTLPSAAQRFTERALRIEVLPGVNLARLDLANATVGANTLAVPPTTTGPTTSTTPTTTVADVCTIAITGIDPASGPTLGGTLVTLTGTGLAAATGVSFGGTPALEFTNIGDTTIEAIAPAHAPGAVTVAVTGATGCSTGTIGYEYLGPDDTPEGEPGGTTTLPAPPPGDPTPATLPATGDSTAGSTAAVAALLLALGAGLLLTARRRTT
ncbi:MAG TPA: choice-of-anchor G family protein [Ilumatobacter sp.]|nr:choice-of-anchor G family protein [Ilumatobacter sp.]